MCSAFIDKGGDDDAADSGERVRAVLSIVGLRVENDMMPPLLLLLLSCFLCSKTIWHPPTLLQDTNMGDEGRASSRRSVKAVRQGTLSRLDEKSSIPGKKNTIICVETPYYCKTL